MGRAIIIASVIFSAAYLLANMHTSVGTQTGFVYVINNITGSATRCVASGCYALKALEPTKGE
jgi:hypothetical protein